MQGRPQEALPEIERVQLDDVRLYLYALAYYAHGQKKEADAALNELIAKYHARLAYHIAEVYAFRKQPDQAFGWLDRAYVQRDDSLIATNPEELTQRPAICRVVEEAQPAKLTLCFRG